MSFVRKFNRPLVFTSRFFSKKVRSEIVSVEDIRLGNYYQENLPYDPGLGLNIKFDLLKDEEREEMDRLAEVASEHATRN